jgi:hypothetical protein
LLDEVGANVRESWWWRGSAVERARGSTAAGGIVSNRLDRGNRSNQKGVG